MRTRLFQRGILQQKARGCPTPTYSLTVRVISSCPACPDLQRCWSSRTSTSDSGAAGSSRAKGTSWGQVMKCVRPLFQFLDSVLDQMSTCCGHRVFSVFFFRFFVLLGVASCSNSLDCAASQHWLRKYLVLFFGGESVFLFLLVFLLVLGAIAAVLF